MKTLVLLVCFSPALLAQTPAAQSPLAEIVSRMGTMNDARTAALHAYSNSRTYTVTYKGFPSSASATAVVKLEFVAPDSKKFTIVSQQGSKLLINRVIRKALESEQEAAKPDFRKRSALDETNYDFKYVGNDTEEGRPCYLLDVEPKRDDKYLYNGRICVDAADYAVARIEAKPAKNPSFWINRAHIDSRNRKHGEFWFPFSTRSTSHVRLGGDAELNIDYGEYVVQNAATVRSSATALP